MSGEAQADWKPLKSVGLMAAIGPLLAQRSQETWRYGLQTGPLHANAIGVIHGGTLTALVDQAMSLIAWEAVERQPVVTVHMDTTFLSSAKPGDFLEVEARLVDRKGSMVFLDAEIISDDALILKASCVMKCVKSRPGEERDNGNSG